MIDILLGNYVFWGVFLALLLITNTLTVISNCNLGLLHSLLQITIVHLLVKYGWHLNKAGYEDRMDFAW